MSYIDGFLVAVPTANKQKFIEYSTKNEKVFIDHGAMRVMECWGDDVPKGEGTDFYKAVEAKEDETIVFGWVEWPDKAARDAAMSKMFDPDNTDSRVDAEKNPMPFDGKRMVYGRFSPVVELKA